MENLSGKEIGTGNISGIFSMDRRTESRVDGQKLSEIKKLGDRRENPGAIRNIRVYTAYLAG